MPVQKGSWICSDPPCAGKKAARRAEEKEAERVAKEDILAEAAGAGDAALVRRLLAARPDLRDKKVNDWTPLMMAAVNGHPGVAG